MALTAKVLTGTFGNGQTIVYTVPANTITRVMAMTLSVPSSGFSAEVLFTPSGVPMAQTKLGDGTNAGDTFQINTDGWILPNPWNIVLNGGTAGNTYSICLIELT